METGVCRVHCLPREKLDIIRRAEVRWESKMAEAGGGFVTRSFERMLKDAPGKKYTNLQNALKAYLGMCTLLSRLECMRINTHLHPLLELMDSVRGVGSLSLVAQWTRCLILLRDDHKLTVVLWLVVWWLTSTWDWCNMYSEENLQHLHKYLPRELLPRNGHTNILLMTCP